MMKSLILGFMLAGMVGIASAQQNSPVVPGDQPDAAQPSSDNSGAQAPESDDLRVFERQQQQQYQQRMRARRTAQPCITPEERFNHCHEVWPGTVQTPETPDPVVDPRKSTIANRKVSGITSAANQINPNDVNYGGLLSEWNLHIVDETILDAEFWAVILLGLAVVIQMLYISWLHRQRADRFRITVDIVMQLLNSRDWAIHRNLQIVKKHNDMVERYDEGFDKDEPRALRSSDSDVDEPEIQVAPLTQFAPVAQIAPAEQIARIASESAGEEPAPKPIRAGVPFALAGNYAIDSEQKPAAVELSWKRKVTTQPDAPGSDSDDPAAVLEYANSVASALAVAPVQPTTESAPDESEYKRLQRENKALQQKVGNLRTQIRGFQNKENSERAEAVTDPETGD